MPDQLGHFDDDLVYDPQDPPPFDRFCAWLFYGCPTGDDQDTLVALADPDEPGRRLWAHRSCAEREYDAERLLARGASLEAALHAGPAEKKLPATAVDQPAPGSASSSDGAGLRPGPAPNTLPQHLKVDKKMTRHRQTCRPQALRGAGIFLLRPAAIAQHGKTRVHEVVASARQRRCGALLHDLGDEARAVSTSASRRSRDCRRSATTRAGLVWPSPRSPLHDRTVTALDDSPGGLTPAGVERGRIHRYDRVVCFPPGAGSLVVPACAGYAPPARWRVSCRTGKGNSFVAWNFMQVQIVVGDMLIKPMIGPGGLNRDQAHAEIQHLLDQASRLSPALEAIAATWRRGAADDTVYAVNGLITWTIYKHTDGDDPRHAALQWLEDYAQTMRAAGLTNIAIAKFTH